MAAWLIPALTAVIPHIGSIISAAVPVFTRKNADAVANQNQLLQQQITELQVAASDNAMHIRELAAQMQTTVAALEQGASLAEKNIRRAYVLGIVATTIALVAIGLAVYILFTQSS